MTLAVREPAEISPAEFEQLPDAHRFDYVAGRLEERSVSQWSSEIAAEINRRIGNYAVESKRGRHLQPDSGLRIFPDPSDVLFPDGGFISNERRGSIGLRGYLTAPPELLLEVTSPNDRLWRVMQKVQTFLRAGVDVVWVAVPETRTITVYRRDGTIRLLSADETLTEEEILPGFSAPVAELLPPVPASELATLEADLV